MTTRTAIHNAVNAAFKAAGGVGETDSYIIRLIDDRDERRHELDTLLIARDDLDTKIDKTAAEVDRLNIEISAAFAPQEKIRMEII